MTPRFQPRVRFSFSILESPIFFFQFWKVRFLPLGSPDGPSDGDHGLWKFINSRHADTSIPAQSGKSDFLFQFWKVWFFSFKFGNSDFLFYFWQVTLSVSILESHCYWGSPSIYLCCINLDRGNHASFCWLDDSTFLLKD